MIAKIYPDGHPDLQGKKDPKHPVRYFDIRKLTPPECYTLMGVPQQRIAQLMATEKRPYTAFIGVEEDLRLFGLEESASMKDVLDAYKEAMQSCDEFDQETQKKIDEGYLNPDSRPTTDEDGEEIIYPYDDEESYQRYLEQLKEDLEGNKLVRQNYDERYAKIRAAPTEERFGDVQIISNSSHYKLAGNSIVCDVLMYIYEEFLYPTGRRIPTEQQDLFALPQFRLERDWKKKPLKLVTLCSGYDSQAIAFDMLKERYPDFDYELTAWAEFDPESKRPLEEQPAVVAHNLLFPQWADRNRGDMTKCDWSDLKDAEIDFLTYSTPCQSISQAGKREGDRKSVV